MKTRKKPIKCPYCGHTAVLRDASYVYGENAVEEHLYVCSRYPECNAYVGVHKGTFIPKGTLANGDLRHKRIETHKVFSKLWPRNLWSRTMRRARRTSRVGRMRWPSREYSSRMPA